LNASTRIALVSALIAALVLVPAALAGKAKPPSSGGGSTSSSSCSIAPGQVVLDQVWTVSASKLPTGGTVNMILTFPDGGQSTGPVTVNADGTYTTTGNSNMSASWGFISPEQTGTYTYQFVGKVRWPSGSYNQVYATCSVNVA
jgi:hypothetical protein